MAHRDKGQNALRSVYELFENAGANPENALLATIGVFGMRAVALAEDYLVRHGVVSVAESGSTWKRLLAYQAPDMEHLNDDIDDLSKYADQDALIAQRIDESISSKVVRRALLQMDAYDMSVKDSESLRSLNRSLDLFIEELARNKKMMGLTTLDSFNNLVVRLALARRTKAVESVYDPTCGVGGTLVAAYEVLKKREADKKVRLYGVDTSSVAVMVTAWRLFLRGFTAYELRVADVLNPQEKFGWSHDDYFDIVCTVPPLYPTRKPRPSIGNPGLQPLPSENRRADYLFVQHVIDKVKPGGRAVIAIALTALNRSGQHETARKNLICHYGVESVISVPETAVPRIGAAPALLVLDLKTPHPHDALYFLAVGEKRGASPRAKPLDDDAVESILLSYTRFRSQPSMSALVDVATVSNHNYSLVPEVYISHEVVTNVSDRVPKTQVDALEREFATASESLDKALERITQWR